MINVTAHKLEKTTLEASNQNIIHYVLFFFIFSKYQNNFLRVLFPACIGNMIPLDRTMD